MITVCRLHAQGDLRVESLPDAPLGPGHVRVAIARGGICGSDLHYLLHGGFGPVRVQEPIILGHEIAGTVVETASDVTGVAAGTRVAVSPSQPCLSCHYCTRSEFQHCLNMRFLGSARSMPHVQGGFRTALVVRADQCVAVSRQTDLAHAACAEPLAVCLHAAAQAGDLRGARVLVTGAGPIGALCVAVAKARGAAEIIATDLADFPLQVARQMGATTCINVRQAPDGATLFQAPATQVDVVFECSAAAPAIAMAIACLRPRGTLVQVGVAGSLELPINAIVGKEITLKGTHRFHPEFQEAVHVIERGEIDMAPLLSHCFAVADAAKAFATATDRTRAMKVQLAF